MGLLRRTVALLWTAALFAQATEYHFRAGAESSLTLTVEKTGLWSGRQHVFEFRKYTAKAVIRRDAPAESSVELSIDAARATCQDAWVSEKDRAKVLAFMRGEMLDVAQHPVLTFRSERIRVSADGSYEIAGRLTIRGIEKPVIVTAMLEVRGSAVAVSGKAIVKLSDYGLKPPRAALGTIGTKDEMAVRFRLVAGGGSL